MEIIEDDAKVWLWVAFDSILNRIELGPKGLLY